MNQKNSNEKGSINICVMINNSLKFLTNLFRIEWVFSAIVKAWKLRQKIVFDISMLKLSWYLTRFLSIALSKATKKNFLDILEFFRECSKTMWKKWNMKNVNTELIVRNQIFIFQKNVRRKQFIKIIIESLQRCYPMS